MDLSRFPRHQLNGSFNALSALRKTVQRANQDVFELNENEEPTAFVVFRRTRAQALRRWTAGGSGGNARMKLANYFNDWRWTMEPLSLSSAAIIRMPINDPMCCPNPKMLLSLNEIRHLSLALSLCERKVYVREKLTFRDRDLQFKHRSFPYKSYKSMGPSSFQQHAEA